MKITRETVDYVANLARLELTEEQSNKMIEDLDKILGYVDKLNELDTSGIEPTAHILPITNVFRDDVTQPSYAREDILANAPTKEDGCIKVPKIVD